MGPWTAIATRPWMVALVLAVALLVVAVLVLALPSLAADPMAGT